MMCIKRVRKRNKRLFMIRKIYQSSGEKGIKEVLIKMKDLIISSDNSRVVKQKAISIIKNVRPDDEYSQIDRIFQWVKDNVKYVRDISGVEELTAPQQILISLNKGIIDFSSDCDDMAMLLSALLRSVGFKTRLEIVALKSDKEYDHARVSVFYNKRKMWLPLEATFKFSRIGDGFASKRNILTLEI